MINFLIFYFAVGLLITKVTWSTMEEQVGFMWQFPITKILVAFLVGVTWLPGLLYYAIFGDDTNNGNDC